MRWFEAKRDMNVQDPYRCVDFVCEVAEEIHARQSEQLGVGAEQSEGANRVGVFSKRGVVVAFRVLAIREVQTVRKKR